MKLCQFNQMLFLYFLPCLLFFLTSAFFPWWQMKDLLGQSAALPDKGTDMTPVKNTTPILSHCLHEIPYPVRKIKPSTWPNWWVCCSPIPGGVLRWVISRRGDNIYSFIKNIPCVLFWEILGVFWFLFISFLIEKKKSSSILSEAMWDNSSQIHIHKINTKFAQALNQFCK